MRREHILSIVKWTLYSLLFLLALLLQTSVSAGSAPYFPLACVPVTIALVAMQEGAEKGGLFALLTSLVWCLSGVSYGSLQIVTLTVAAVCSGALCERILTRRLLPAILISLAALVFNEGLCFLLRCYLATAELPQFLTVTLPNIAASAPVILPTYLITRLIGKVGK